MGYHIININESKVIERNFVNTIEDLAKLSIINHDTIIYQGEKHWTAVRASDSDLYKDYCNDWYRAAILAQFLFKKQAEKEGLILEELNQTQESFKSYTNSAGYKSIKRGDFLIRNVRNLEVDVKCRTIKPMDGDSFFHFKVLDLKKHMNMISFTNTPIVIAVYGRNIDKPIHDELYMFDIEALEEQKKNFRKEFVSVNDTGECYKIPVSFATKGFDLINEHRQRLNM